jgi:hypothetical protein
LFAYRDSGVLRVDFSKSDNTNLGNTKFLSFNLAAFNGPVKLVFTQWLNWSSFIKIEVAGLLCVFIKIIIYYHKLRDALIAATVAYLAAV